MPDEVDGSVWDDIGLRFRMSATSLRPALTVRGSKRRQSEKVVFVEVVWTDWSGPQATLLNALASKAPAEIIEGLGGPPVPPGLRCLRAPPSVAAEDVFLPLDPSSAIVEKGAGAEAILCASINAEPPSLSSLPKGVVILRPVNVPPAAQAPATRLCTHYLPFRDLQMKIEYEIQQLPRWRDIRNAALAIAESMVVETGSARQG